jgi:hypothetical protein
LNNQITSSSYAANNNVCSCSMFCNQIQGEHTLTLRTDFKKLSYFSNYWGYLKPFQHHTVPIIHQNIKTSRITFANFNNNSIFYKLSYDVNRKKFCLL